MKRSARLKRACEGAASCSPKPTKGDTMRTPDRSPEFEAAGRSLVTDVKPPGCTGGFDDLGRFGHDGDTCPVHEAASDEKLDDAMSFGTKLRGLVSVAWGGNPGQVGVSLWPTPGVATFQVHTPRGTYIVKCLRAEDYPQEF